ncbi:MAG: transcriptional regulator [Acidimicrobiales bacterium]
MVMDDVEIEERYAEKVGARLRAVRKQKKLSLQAVEAMSNMEFKASVLGAYERGERSISVPRLQRLAGLYAVPVDQLLPQDSGFNTATSELFNGLGISSEMKNRVVTVDGASNGDGVPRRYRWEPDGKVTIDLTKLNSAAGPERDLIKRYLDMIQVQRQDFNGRMITIRFDDLRIIGALLEMSPRDIAIRLAELGLRLTS